MKRRMHLLAVTAALAGVALLGAGCTGTTSTSDSASKDAKDITIAFVPGITSDPFFGAMKLGAEAEAKKLGVKLIWQGSSKSYSPETQMPFVDAVLAQNVDALIMSPTNPDGLQVSVAKATAQGVPVITVDTTVNDRSDLISHITGDNVDGGRQAAIELARQVGEKGKVFLMMSSPTDTTNVLREKGFMDELKNYPNIEFVGVQYHNSQAEVATSAVNTVLLEHADLAGIFAINGTAVTGSVAAIRNNNRQGDVKLVGYDAYSTEVEALKEGIVTALIAQRPAEEAAMALQFAVAKITGKNLKSIKKEVILPNVVMTMDNFTETSKYEYAE